MSGSTRASAPQQVYHAQENLGSARSIAIRVSLALSIAFGVICASFVVLLGMLQIDMMNAERVHWMAYALRYLFMFVAAGAGVLGGVATLVYCLVRRA